MILQWVQQSIKNITEDSSNDKACYVTHEDICKSFEGDTLLAIQAPHGTQLEVPIPEMQANQKRKYQIHLKSTDGQIYVLLVNKDSEHESPVAVQVPPPADVAEAIEKASESIENRQVGKKSKALEGSDDLKAAKRAKLDDSEVESILSGKVLNTDIPGLEDFMSSESKFDTRIYDNNEIWTRISRDTQEIREEPRNEKKFKRHCKFPK